MKKPQKTLVVDSSVAVKWLNSQNEKYIEEADKILKDVQNDKAVILMPELAKYEVANALINKKMLLPNTLSSLATFFSIPIQFITQDNQQANSATQIAIENSVTYYDASFMALAKESKSKLITANPKHQDKNIKGLTVVYLQNYK